MLTFSGRQTRDLDEDKKLKAGRLDSRLYQDIVMEREGKEEGVAVRRKLMGSRSSQWDMAMMA
jgi:hypothetical protein